MNFILKVSLLSKDTPPSLCLSAGIFEIRSILPLPSHPSPLQHVPFFLETARCLCYKVSYFFFFFPFLVPGIKSRFSCCNKGHSHSPLSTVCLCRLWSVISRSESSRFPRFPSGKRNSCRLSVTFHWLNLIYTLLTKAVIGQGREVIPRERFCLP